MFIKSIWGGIGLGVTPRKLQDRLIRNRCTVLYRIRPTGAALWAELLESLEIR
ncbi:MAG: hypothetical protein WCO60_16645 [Verrucomicrobiota bacterium]